MKANELMIGDWVQGFLPDTYSQVYGVINECRVAIVGGGAYMEVSNEDIQPIPLTAEILEKNGFDCNQDSKTSIDLVYHGCARITEYGEEVLEDGKMIRYVHELQHALRLCGIDKEIVL